jgi:uncharacterized membrane protein YqiK
MLGAVPELVTVDLSYFAVVAGIGLFLVLIVPSFKVIKKDEVGLVVKRFGFKNLKDDMPIAFRGEPGYQARLLTPGLRFKFWVLYSVQAHPWVQVPAGEIGVELSRFAAV